MRLRKMKWLGIAGILVAGLALATACAREEVKGKSMVQVYREKGVPVRVMHVQSKPFVTEYSYVAALKGVKESNAGAPIGGTIHRIHHQVGDVVVRDAVVMSFPTNSPATQYDQARVAFNLAETTLERINNLYAAGGVSRQELDTVQTRFDIARANWDAARQSVHVRAPIAGTITQISVRESDSVEEKTLLFTVARTDQLKAEVWVNEHDIAHMRVGDRAVAEWKHIAMQGEVTRINRTVNPMRQAFGVVVEFENFDQKVFCGVNAAITITSADQSEAIALGREAIRFEDNKAFVFVVQDGLAVRREVRIGRKSGMRVEILHGLLPGEIIVTEGLMLVENGSPLNIIDSLLNAATNREERQ